MSEEYDKALNGALHASSVDGRWGRNSQRTSELQDLIQNRIDAWNKDIHGHVHEWHNQGALETLEKCRDELALDLFHATSEPLIVADPTISTAITTHGRRVGVREAA